MVCPKSITNILPITFLKTEINSPSRNIKSSFLPEMWATKQVGKKHSLILTRKDMPFPC